MQEERLNKRIKLLNDIINGSWEEVTQKDAKILLDYITNLQEENEMYKKELEKADSITQSCIFEGSRSAGKSYRQCLNWLEDYKSRNEKAIEYINHENFKRTILVGVGTKKYTRNILDNVLNILQGVDKE